MLYFLKGDDKGILILKMICVRQGLRKYKYKQDHKDKTATNTKKNTRATDRPLMYVFEKEMTIGV